jgi:hypothetical protein
MRVYQTLQAVCSDGVTPAPFTEPVEMPYGPDTDDYFKVSQAVLSCMELSRDSKFTKTLDITIKF